MLRKISVDNMQLDSLQIIEDSKCCLKVNAIITKVGVYDYSDSPVHHMGKDLTKALKSAPELLKATRTARAAKLVVLEHPSSSMPVVTSQGQMKGYVEKPFFDRDKIRAQLNFDKQECSESFIEKVRAAADKSGEPLDVSVGFYHEVDPTSGIWQGEEYDYVMRNMVIDHVACGVPRGRCSFPNCGIGTDANISVDDAIRGVYFQQDPWETTEEYIRSGHRAPPEGGQCRTMELSAEQGIKAVICKYGEKWEVQSYLFDKAKWDKAKAQEWFNDHKSDSKPEDKLKEEFVKSRMKEGLSKEKAEAQYEDLTKPQGEKPKEETPPKEQPPAKKPPAEAPPPPKEKTTEEVIKESEELQAILKDI
ncbi:DUF2213 domain-containing protein [Candidatus Bathyarchaeota archaeon]|nr:DUF2213 domain-containing protein [Candidatus Bathyarchaeota archaeon]